jgi:hypothetical protein
MDASELLGTVHVRDATGTIRAIQLPQSTIAAADSIQVIGSMVTLLGQPVLRHIHTSILDRGFTPPAPDSVATGTAAIASGGTLDAGLVRVAGPGRILLDRHVPFALNWPRQDGQPVSIGTRITATGLLVPREQGLGEWVIKPRGTAGVELRPGS